MTLSTPTRRRRTAIAAALLAAVAVLPACGGEGLTPKPATAATKSEAGVRAAYTDFEKASASKGVSKLVTRSTLDYFDHLRDLALDADQATMLKQPLIDQVTALGLRAKSDPKLLRTGSPEDLVEASAAAGASSGATPQATALPPTSKITITGDKAVANDSATPDQKVDFAYEGGRWKVDITSVFAQVEKQVETMAKGDPKAFVEQAMAAQVGGADKVAALWKPVGR